MGNEQLMAFGEAVQADAALRDEVQGLGENVAAIVAVGEREGFSFSAAELDAFLQTYESGGRELSDAELEDVSGSGIYTSCTCEPCGRG